VHAGEIGTRAHDEHLLRRHAPARDRNLAIGIVGGDRDIGEREAPAFEPAEQLPEEIVAAEFRLVELGPDIVLVEDEAHAEKNLPETCHEKDEIWRIAGLDHVEAARNPHAHTKHKFPEQRARIFEEITGRASRLEGQVVAPDIYAVNDLE
jgi:hypothetical protein